MPIIATVKPGIVLSVSRFTAVCSERAVSATPPTQAKCATRPPLPVVLEAAYPSCAVRAMEEPADSATVAVGGAVLAVVALFVGGMHTASQAMGLWGVCGSLPAVGLLMGLLDKELSFAAWACCQWLAAKLVQMTGAAARELPHDE